MLVWDRNGNGQIDDGSELFGNYSILANDLRAANGFVALADLDSNHDGKVDASDAAFSQLRVWKDGDSDAKLDAGELLSLSEVNVGSLNTAYASQNQTDAQGNQVLQTGTYTDADGVSHSMNDVWFSVDKARTQNLNQVAVSTEIAALPEVAGFGNVTSLRQAMAQDSSGHLQVLINQFGQATDATAREALLNEILFAWTGANQYTASSRGGYIADGRKLYALEAFMGETFTQGFGTNAGLHNPGPNAGGVLMQAYDKLANYVSSQLMAQTHFKGFYDSLQLTWDSATSSYVLDVSVLVSKFQAAYETDQPNAILTIREFATNLSANGSSGAEIREALISKGNINAQGFLFTLATLAMVERTGDDSANTLSSDAGVSTIFFGRAGSDTLNGNSGADVLDGGIGNDVLNGGAGTDTYLLAVGSGIDRISDYDTTVGNTDVAQFGDVASTAITSLERKGNDLVLKYGSSDQVSVANYFSAVGYQVEQFKFSDGVTWDQAAIKARVLTIGDAAANSINGYDDGSNRIYGLDGNDNLSGGLQDDRLEGDNGNDTLSGDAGADSLLGGADNDTLTGGAGNDTLEGGTGNDALNDAVGNDTYLFATGSGIDRISDSDATVGNTDVLQFSDVASTAITSLERKGNDLVLKYGSSDQVSVANYFSNAVCQVEQFKFSDGVTWDQAAIKARVLTIGDAAANTLNGYDDGSNRIYGLDGNDNLSGGLQADRLEGDNGNDTLSGDAGADSLLGGADNDTLTGGAGNDTLDGGTGNDLLNDAVGNDTYLLATGSGIDRISDYDTTVGNTDVAQFGDVASTAITSLERKGNDLVLKYGSSDQVSVANYFSAVGYQVEQFKFSDGVTWDQAAIKARVITVGDANANSISGYNDGSNRIYGLEGNDNLSGGLQADLLDGGAGNDTLNGGAGNDTLDGGTGNDTLNDAAGNDTYLFASGSGIDRISDYDTTVGNTDVVQFGDVASTAITSLERKGVDLVLKYGSSDQVSVANYFSAVGYQVEQFKFSDGVTWDQAAIKARVITVGDANANSISGYNDGGNRIYGLDGNDNLTGGLQADLLDGGAGNDTLNGGAGNDTLDGGTGNDALNDAAGNDTYLFATGSGIDRVSDYDTTVGNTDVVQFGDVASTAITSLERKGNDLVLKYGSSDQVSVANYFSNVGYQVEQFKFSDGVTWDQATIKARVITVGDANANSISGYNDGSNRIYGLDGNDNLTGGLQADLLDGGAGNDTLNGGAGNDTLDGGTGNDALNDAAGNDTYLFATGSGIDRVSDYDTTVGNTDVVQFGDVASTAITSLERKGADLVLKYGSSDQVSVANYFSNVGYQVEQFKFSDGVTWDQAAIKARVITVGDANANSISGYNDGSNRIYGLDGNDNLSGGLQADLLDGGAGNDTLNGGAGNDTLDGGIGNDVLNGSTGSDTYQFAAGAGVDRISDYDTIVGNTDKLSLGSDVAPDQLWFRRTGSDLEVSIIGTTDKVSISNWYSGSAYHVEQFKTSDGKTLLDSQVQNLVDTMASFGVPAGGEGNLTTSQRDQLNVVIASNWQ